MMVEETTSDTAGNESSQTPVSSEIGRFSLVPDMSGSGECWRLAATLTVGDHPGELAELSTLAASHGVNVERFFYNRTKDMRRVFLEISSEQAVVAGELADALRDGKWFERGTGEAERSPRITALDGLLHLKVTLENKPGQLATVSSLVASKHCNIIFVEYDWDKAPCMVELAVAASRAEDIEALLDRLDREGYHYHVKWSGGSGPKGTNARIDRIIGLSMVESFFLKLKSLLPPERVEALSDMLHTSDEMQECLLEFKRQAGNSGESLAASEVFEQMLQLAASSAGKTGPNFHLSLTGPMRLSRQVDMYMLQCPTGSNVFLLRHGDEYTLIDTCYGLYFSDAMDWLQKHNLDPGKIRTALVTHPDADHAGWALPLQQKYGTEIYMHPLSEGVFAEENRTYGGGTRLSALNRAYTRLIGRFTDSHAPQSLKNFNAPAGNLPAEASGFKVIGSHAVADLTFWVLESLGGHVPAQVFFYEPDHGLLFCGDYLIDIPSLSEREKDTLSIARYLITSTNADSRVFVKEMGMLKALMQDAQNKLSETGGEARVFPGHGGFYGVSEVNWEG